MGRRLAAIPSRTWLRVRRRILDRDGYRCRECGKPGRLEVHHRVPLARGGAALDPDNLLTLCACCHKRQHTDPDPERRAWRDYLRAYVVS